MIIELIVLLIAFGSLIGFIIGARHYLRHHRLNKENKKILLALEENPKEAKNERFYKGTFMTIVDWIEENIGFGRIVKWTLIIGTVFMIYQFLVAPNFSDSNNANIVPEKQINPNINNTNSSGDLSIAEILKKPDSIPTWLWIIILGIPLWMIWKIFTRSSRFDF